MQLSKTEEQLSSCKVCILLGKRTERDSAKRKRKQSISFHAGKCDGEVPETDFNVRFSEVKLRGQVKIGNTSQATTSLVVDLVITCICMLLI